ncbi:MAG: hypothetical protein M0Z33_09710 [Actinomycetota bacterium]|nr:hypothetical protein [Actinomycetota bacterium]
MTAPTGGGELPLLALPYRQRALSPWAVSEAASGVCRILWVLGLEDPPDAATARLLRRLGSVVDLGEVARERRVDALGERGPDGMLVLSDHDMVELAEIAGALGLLFNPPGTCRNLTDKASQRRALAAAGIPTPRSGVVSSADDRAGASEAAAATGFPAVLKPQLGGDSRMTFRIADEESLRAVLAGLAADRLGAAASPFPMVLEEYLTDAPPALGASFANYLSVESLVYGPTIDHLATTGRFSPAEPFRERGFFIPSTASGPLEAELLDLADAAARALGVVAGALHTEIKITPAGPRVIEVNGRLGGGIPAMLELASGVSAVRLAMAAALGGRPSGEGVRSCSAVGYRMLVQGPMWATEVVAVEGLDRVAEIPGVAAVALHRGPGSAIDWRTGNHDYVFSVLGVVPDHDALATLDRTVLDTTSIVYGSDAPRGRDGLGREGQLARPGDRHSRGGSADGWRPR